MNCKIQTLCVKTNIRVSFTPPEVTDEDCIKILYHHHQDFTVCQRVVEIRMNDMKRDSSKQLEPDFSEICTEEMGYWQLVLKNYNVVCGYDYSCGIDEVEIFASLSVLQKFERFFEKIPHDSSIAFIFNQSLQSFAGHYVTFFTLFVKALLRYLGRKPPIDAKYDPDIIQKWLSNNEPRRDLIAHSTTLNNMKAKFIINLSTKLSEFFYLFAARNATSQYTHICLPNPSRDELNAMKFLSSEKNDQNHVEYSMHRSNMKKYLRRTDF